MLCVLGKNSLSKKKIVTGALKMIKKLKKWNIPQGRVLGGGERGGGLKMDWV